VEEYTLLGCDTIIWYVFTSVAYAVSQPQEDYSLYIRQRENIKSRFFLQINYLF